MGRGEVKTLVVVSSVTCSVQWCHLVVQYSNLNAMGSQTLSRDNSLSLPSLLRRPVSGARRWCNG